MKNIINICFFLLMLSLSGKAQNIVSEQAVEILGGYTGDGYSGALGYINYLSDRWLLRADVVATFEEKYKLKHTTYGIDVYGGYTMKYFRFAEMYANVLFGLMGSYETGSLEGKEDDFSTFKYGGMAGVELEKYFSNYWSVTANFNQRYVLNQNDLWGDYRWSVQLGIRFHIPKFVHEE